MGETKAVQFIAKLEANSALIRGRLKDLAKLYDPESMTASRQPTERVHLCPVSEVVCR